MLHFLRKHQKYFFFVITVVVIASFSFFGTYDTLTRDNIHDQTAFTAIDGSNVTRAELESMVIFLSTDNDDKRLFGGAWGPNFLNDGVVKNDILATGLGEILAASYPELVGEDLASRLEKEKRFTFYSHPQARFVSVESAWEYFAPSMKQYLRTLRKAENASDPNAFSARVALYLTERQFPAPLLRQVLHYQQQQQGWLTPDPNLDHIDLSMFGYHTLEDWFGNSYMRLIAEFIINSSKIAEQRGYNVTKEEALASLMENAEVSFQQNLDNPHLGVSNSTEYMNEQFRLLGMDRTKAVKVWSQVLLFRRLFQDVGNTVITDPLSHEMFNTYAKEKVNGDLYRLSPEMRLRDFHALQKFETYLYAVAKRPRIDKMNDTELLSLPTAFLTVDEVKKKYPELVQKKYELEVSQVNKNSLQSKISLKETWNWEVEDANWDKLKNEFSDLGVYPGKTREERFAALDKLDDRTRGRVDNFARSAIVDAHPEWLDKALNEASYKKMAIGIRQKGGHTPFIGIENREELMQLLDNATINEEPSGKLARYTGNNSVFYRIKVLEKNPQEEILSFAEADKEGVLDQLLDQTLEAQYLKMRENKPSEYQKEDKSWKSLAEVKDKIAELYYDKLLKAIQDSSDEDKVLTNDRLASLRFFAYMQESRENLKNGNTDSQLLLKKSNEGHKALQDQWKLEKVDYNTSRSSDDKDINNTEMFAIAPNEWTPVHTPANGDLYFFQLKERGLPNDDLTAAYDEIHQAHAMLSNDAQRNLMYSVIKKLKEKHAISLDYLNSREETMVPEEEGDKGT